MNNIKKARLLRGLGQKEIAAALDVSQPTVSAWESGSKAPNNKNLVLLSDLLEVSVDFLLGNNTDSIDTKKEAPSTLEDAERAYVDLLIESKILSEGKPLTSDEIEKMRRRVERGLRFIRENAD